ncbi:MAG TPA: two-component regulator propeller domain-containing protein [Bacteroidia bacterium]|jgi:ligand-binding sensor domain-containing protein/serine phosphatase RsbU (regulator of sigma subunit)|nr:two-component regulator propeller domain-containing protein [Bacteroidia bacterium]
MRRIEQLSPAYVKTSADKTAKQLILCFHFLFIFLFSNAQTLNLNQFGIEEGLPQSSVYTMLQGKDGSIWVGTMNGVSKYSGLNFENFSKKNGLAENRVTSSCQDKEGNIWFGHWSGGITKYDIQLKKFSEVHPDKIKLSKTITSIVADKNGTIWFGTNGEGLVKYQNGQFTAYTSENGLPDNHINALMIGKDGQVWIGTENGVSVYKRNFSAFSKDLPSKSIKCFLEEANGNIWIGTSDKGVIRMNANYAEMKNFTTSSGLASNNIKVMFQAENGSIFIGTNSDGISKYIPRLENTSYAGPLFSTISTQHGLSNDHIFSIIQDREKNIWIGTQLNLNQYFDEQFEIFGENDGLSNSLVWSVIQDKDENFWIGTEGGLVKFIPDIHKKTTGERLINVSSNSSYVFTHKTGKNNEVLNTSALYEDIKGNIWYSDFGKGITRLNPGTNESKHFTTETGLPSNEIYAITGDKDGNIWIGTNKGGVLKFDIQTEKFKTYTTKDGLGSDQVYAIFCDSKNRLWFGCLGGKLSMLDSQIDDSFHTFSEQKGYPCNFTLCITEDKKGNMWFGAFDQGIYKFDGTAFKNYSSKEGLSSDTPFLLVCDNDDHLWIGTGLGIDRLDLKDETIKHYEKQDGFLGIEINPNATLKDKEGNLWFGSIVGLVKYNAKLAKKNLVEAITSIKDPRIFFQNVTLPEDHVFSWNQNHVTFDFIGTSLTNPKRVKYRYFLEGVDKDWSPVVKENSVTYPNLEAGSYTFKVRSSNNDGVWNKEPVVFHFEISAPFWKKSWFYLVIASSALVIAMIYVQWRERRLKRQNIILEKRVEERTLIISKQKDEIERKNNVIIDSIEYAKNIQQSILPTKLDLGRIFPQHFILNRPKDIVSGDFYWLHETTDRIFIAVADCTGHGVPGAFMSFMGYNLLNETVREKPKDNPAEMLNVLNLKVLNSLKQHDTNTSAKYGMDISLIAIDKEKNILEFSGAHNSLLIFRGNENFQLKADRLSVGSTVRDDITTFTNHKFELKKGDMLYLYTDGYPDQTGGPDNKKFFANPFRELLQSISKMEEEEQCKILDETILKWRGAKSQIDDILVVGFRI